MNGKWVEVTIPFVMAHNCDYTNWHLFVREHRIRLLSVEHGVRRAIQNT